MRSIRWAILVCATILLQLGLSAARANTPNMSPRPAVMLNRTEEFITVNRSDSAALYTTTSGKLVREFSANGHYITSLTLSPDEHYLLAACLGGTTKVWEIENGGLRCSVQSPHAADTSIYDASFSGDGRSFVLANKGRHVLIYETVSGRLIQEMRFPAEVYGVSCALSPDGSKGMVASQYKLFGFDVAQGKLEATDFRGFSSVRYSSLGDFLALQDDTYVYLVPVDKGGSSAGRKLGPFGQIQRLEPLHDGTFLITSMNSDRQTIGSIIDPKKTNPREVFKLEDTPYGMACSPQQMKGVVTTYATQTNVYELRTGTLEYTIDNGAEYRSSPEPHNPFTSRTPGLWESDFFQRVLVISVLIATPVVLGGIYWAIWKRNSRKDRTTV